MDLLTKLEQLSGLRQVQRLGQIYSFLKRLKEKGHIAVLQQPTIFCYCDIFVPLTQYKEVVLNGNVIIRSFVR